jgi:LmbE family N-acetylglucosaminyl deacetylase
MVRRSLALLLLPALLATPLGAQQGGPLQPPSTGGLPVLLQELRMLGHQKRVLMIAAHPDDEDTELLVMLTRREGAEAAYLSLTRGEGGQNLIGNELGEALGILRTEELLAARNVDGAQQFFTRAYDFGFSKTLEDTWAHWPKDSVLKDVVRIIRRFRPQVVVSVFSGAPRDGHGQHQAAGWAAAEAFRVAGDPRRFPELEREEGLSPWTPTKLYRSARFDPEGRTLTVDGGEVEKVSGKTYHQLAMAARSLHRSQDMGRLQEFGPSIGGLERLGGRDAGEGWSAFWTGVDTTLAAPPEHFLALAEARTAAGRDPLAVDEALRRAQGTLRPGAATAPPIDDLQEHLMAARRVVSWVFVDLVAERERVSPGERLALTLSARNAGRRATDPFTAFLVRRGAPLFWTEADGALGAGEVKSRRTEVAIASDLAPSTPYYLRAPRNGDLYTWDGARMDVRGLPVDEDEVTGGLGAAPPNGIASLYLVSAVVRIRDQAFGEVRRPVVVVPRIGVKLSPGVAVVRTGATGEGRVVTADVSLENGVVGTVSGTVSLELPAGWPRPAPAPFRIEGLGATAHLAVRMTVPADAAEGQYLIRAIVTDAAGGRHDTGAFTVEYPHIRTRQYTRPAVARVEVVDLATPTVRRVAYVRGAADRVPEALAGAGLAVTVLDSVALSTGQLAQYDAIVIGPRAYEVDSALVRNNARLLDYARNGGRLVVQYQQGIFTQGGFAPFPVTQGDPADRTTDEHSPVVMLGARPTQSALAPLFRTPNAIGPEDWDGWVQDRALYCLRSWDDRYASLLSMNDPGERSIGGCLLEAPLGRGSYVYTGIAFFRQLPAGVPGAYRLFFNLLGGRVIP